MTNTSIDHGKKNKISDKIAMFQKKQSSVNVNETPALSPMPPSPLKQQTPKNVSNGSSKNLTLVKESPTLEGIILSTPVVRIPASKFSSQTKLNSEVIAPSALAAQPTADSTSTKTNSAKITPVPSIVTENLSSKLSTDSAKASTNAQTSHSSWQAKSSSKVLSPKSTSDMPSVSMKKTDTSTDSQRSDFTSQRPPGGVSTGISAKLSSVPSFTTNAPAVDPPKVEEAAALAIVTMPLMSKSTPSSRGSASKPDSSNSALVNKMSPRALPINQQEPCASDSTIPELQPQAQTKQRRKSLVALAIAETAHSASQVHAVSSVEVVPSAASSVDVPAKDSITAASQKLSAVSSNAKQQKQFEIATEAASASTETAPAQSPTSNDHTAQSAVPSLRDSNIGPSRLTLDFKNKLNGLVGAGALGGGGMAPIRPPTTAGSDSAPASGRSDAGATSSLKLVAAGQSATSAKSTASSLSPVGYASTANSSKGLYNTGTHSFSYSDCGRMTDSPRDESSNPLKHSQLGRPTITGSKRKPAHRRSLKSTTLAADSLYLTNTQTHICPIDPNASGLVPENLSAKSGSKPTATGVDVSTAGSHVVGGSKGTGILSLLFSSSPRAEAAARTAREKRLSGGNSNGIAGLASPRNDKECSNAANNNGGTVNPITRSRSNSPTRVSVPELKLGSLSSASSTFKKPQGRSSSKTTSKTVGCGCAIC